MEETKSKSSETKTSDKESYHLKMNFNGKEFESDTTDLKKEIMAIKPTFLKTNVVFSCTNPSGWTCDKVILVKNAKMIWKNKVYMDMFINQLIFKEHA